MFYVSTVFLIWATATPFQNILAFGFAPPVVEHDIRATTCIERKRGVRRINYELKTTNFSRQTLKTRRMATTNDDNENETKMKINAITQTINDKITSNPSRSAYFSLWMTLCGAILGPFLDSYHSAFGVLQYDEPIRFITLPLLGGSMEHPALTTAWWVPELFGLAGFLIGWLYILLDEVLQTEEGKTKPEPPFILAGIAFFTLQYWLSGILYEQGTFDRSSIFFIMTTLSAIGFVGFDSSKAGFGTSLATAVGGPLIEVGLISALSGHGGYHYTDLGETGFFPLWICPGEVYIIVTVVAFRTMESVWYWNMIFFLFVSIHIIFSIYVFM